MRVTGAVAACVLLAVTSSSCADTTDTTNTTSAQCAQTAASPATAAPKFAAVVSKVTFQSGITPGGYRSQYDLWVAIPPSSAANAGVLVGTSTPVFIRSANGTLTPAGACSIMMGDALDVWHDGEAVVGDILQAPPGDTAYFSTQVVIRR